MSQVINPHTIQQQQQHHHHTYDTFPPSPASIDKSTKDNVFYPISPHSDSSPAEVLRTTATRSDRRGPFAMNASAGLMHNSKLGQITPPEDNWKTDWTLDFDADAVPALDELDSSDETAAVPANGKPAKSAKGGRVDKRDKYREKNRVAAAKCRAKKKEHIDGLEDNHRTQSMLNALLKQTEQQLRDELSYWRTQALQHGFCDCQAIQEYNLRKARALAANKEFGDLDSMRRDSMAASSPTSQMMPVMYPDPHNFDSPPTG